MKTLIKTTFLAISLCATSGELIAQNDALKILPNGNVGIGTTNPSTMLEVNGDLKAQSGTFTGNSTFNTVFIGDVGYGTDWAGFSHKNSVGQGRYGFLHHKDGIYSLINIKSGTGYIGFRVDNIDKMIINPSGNVGIGTTNPLKPLDVGGVGGIRISQAQGSSENNEIFFQDNGQIRSADNNHRLIFDRASNIIEIREFGDIIMSPGSINGSRTQKVVFKSNGYVGIGTSNPIKGKIEIVGWADYSFSIIGGIGTSNGKYTGSFGAQKSGNWGASIYAEGKMVAHSFIVPSDLRIKEVIGTSNNQMDLKTLNMIQVTDYYYKDVVANGNRVHKKVIAQQVMEVYPQAVSLSTGEVPDVYKFSKIKNGWVDVATNLKKGEIVQLIFGSEKILCEVLETSENGFRVNSDREGEVFVFGRQVDDFHSVDYEAISMLNVSATQELAKQIERLQAENEEKAARIEILEKKLQSFESLKASVERLQEKMQSGSAFVGNNNGKD